jgi:predicted DNA-binding transcriptional regulator AlpA
MLVGAAASAPSYEGDPLDHERLIGRAEFQRLLGVGRATFERMLSRKRVLQPIRLSKTCHRWRLGTVLDWIRAGCPDPAAWLKAQC